MIEFLYEYSLPIILAVVVVTAVVLSAIFGD